MVTPVGARAHLLLGAEIPKWKKLRNPSPGLNLAKLPAWVRPAIKPLELLVEYSSADVVGVFLLKELKTLAVASTSGLEDAEKVASILRESLATGFDVELCWETTRPKVAKRLSNVLQDNEFCKNFRAVPGNNADQIITRGGLSPTASIEDVLAFFRSTTRMKRNRSREDNEADLSKASEYMNMFLDSRFNFEPARELLKRFEIIPLDPDELLKKFDDSDLMLEVSPEQLQTEISRGFNSLPSHVQAELGKLQKELATRQRKVIIHAETQFYLWVWKVLSPGQRKKLSKHLVMVLSKRKCYACSFEEQHVEEMLRNEFAFQNTAGAHRNIYSTGFWSSVAKAGETKASRLMFRDLRDGLISLFEDKPLVRVNDSEYPEWLWGT